LRSEVAGIFYGDSIIMHSTSDVNLVRVYFSFITGDPICISNITDIPNKDGETTVSLVAGDCFTPDVTGINQQSGRSHLTILPNPAKDQVWVNIPSKFGKIAACEMIDAMGRNVQSLTPAAYNGANQISLSLSGLSNGVYLLRMVDTNGKVAIGRVVKH
jgi:hypothetical protein